MGFFNYGGLKTFRKFSRKDCDVGITVQLSPIHESFVDLYQCIISVRRLRNNYKIFPT